MSANSFMERIIIFSFCIACISCSVPFESVQVNTDEPEISDTTPINPEPSPEPEPISELEPMPEPEPMPELEPMPEPAPNTLEAKFSSIHRLILIPKCVGCHSPAGIRPREDYTDFRSTLATGKIIPGNAEGSEMFTECRDQSMPIGSAPLTTAELAVVKTWIDNGAQDN